MEVVAGRIMNYDERKGGFEVFVPYVNHDRMTLREYAAVEVGLPDGRTILPEQRKKAHALIRDIAEWMGDCPESVKGLMKMGFIINHLEGLEKSLFSLSDCDVTTAREFISYLIDFMFEHDIPSGKPLYEYAEDIRRYVYAALKNKRCVLCGRRAELHHVDAVGMGNDRRELFQLGMRVLPLCREHHMIAHAKGRRWLLEDMHLEAIELTKDIARVYGLTKKNVEAIDN